LVTDYNFESYIKTKKCHPLKPVWQLVADVLLSNIRAKSNIGNSIERSLGNLASEGTIFRQRNNINRHIRQNQFLFQDDKTIGGLFKPGNRK